VKNALQIFALFLAIRPEAWTAVVQEVTPERGRTVAPITWTDDSGRTRSLSQLAGFPLILLPIYSRCPGPCLSNIEQLKKTLELSKISPSQFRVLLFSFDEGDTPSSLADYRRREAIPLWWSIGRASPSDIESLVQSIGFQYGKAGKEFMHPNLLLFLDSNLRISKWIYGTDYSARDIDNALTVAQGRSDWIGRHSEGLYATLLFAASAFCVMLCNQVIRLYQLRTPRENCLPD
jgi:protein SCO1/2